MSNAKGISKKRKPLSIPVTRSLIGSFNRINRNKNHSDLPQPFVKKRKNRSPPGDTSTRHDSSSVSIKDLGLKRVFSPSSADEAIPNCFDDAEDLGKSLNGEFKKMDASNEDFTRSTPPDPEDFRAGPVVERNGSGISIKPVLKPCSREKLFKSPGSFSYRRLLPFLTDIEKDRSGSQITGQCQSSKKSFDDKHLSASNGPKTSSDKTTSCPLEGCNADTGRSLIAASVESFASKDNELQASRDDQNSSCSKKYLSSTIEDSPCNARSLEVLDQSLPAVNDKSESCDYEATESSKDDTKESKESEIQGMSKATVSHSFESQHLNSVYPALSGMGGNSKCSLQQRVDNDEVLERVENLNGECTSMTPPDSDMFSKCEIDGSRGIGQVIQEPTNETSRRNNGPGHDKSPDLSPKNKMVPNSHLHLKLSKIPGSFSYRRLLPYLSDIASLNSGAYGNNQSLKVEMSSKRKLVSPFFTSGKDACTDTFDDKSQPTEHHTGYDIKLSCSATMATSSSHKRARSPPKQVAESPIIVDSRQETGPLVKPSALDTSQKLETRPKNVVESTAMSSSSPREGAKFVADRLPLEPEEDCIKSTKKCANRERQTEVDSFVEASIPPGISSVCLQKGILKRNPRGCRGICTCLNCSSFRLHAERSFQFSRNQMQDAEEIALDLMKELSYLRNMLEKSAFVAKDQSNICIDQVKEAIKKASDAEELAKNRLDEMNYDLNIHCRIPCRQRPSVRFADYVQEHVISLIEDSSNK